MNDLQELNILSIVNNLKELHNRTEGKRKSFRVELHKAYKGLDLLDREYKQVVRGL